ncbi:MAG: GMC family oxidoreductase [Gammaproteobacteria bacterium]
MEYDVIIVGAGSAGCVLANRLSASPQRRVLLLEAGGRDTNPWIHIPAGFTRTLNNPAVNWCFDTEPEPNVNGRSIDIPRGKVLGGSSSINGMLYVRGQARDFDGWAQAGNRGWSFDDVLPYFKRSESFERGENGLRGGSGPLEVCDIHERHEMIDAFVAAGEELGYPRNPDYNGERQDGFGYYQVTQRRGRRESAATAFLDPARERPNLTVVTNAFVSRIVLAQGRAEGVVYQAGGVEHRANASACVVLSAGAVQSPQILELSGVGDPQVLARHGIEITHALPGVGAGYRDHYAARLNWRVSRPITLNEQTRGLSLARALIKYLFTRRGVLTLPAGIGHGFIRTRPELETPDVQMFFAHASFASAKDRKFDRSPGMTIGVYQCRPESKGSIHIRSARPGDRPVIRPNFLADPLDRETLVAGLRVARALGETTAMASYRSHEMSPGAHCSSDEALLEHARQTGATTFHPMGTCRMGPDAMAVVDDRLRIHGLEGLRIVDASIMPAMPSGNINAPVLMVAEKGADMIAEDLG